MYIYAFSNYTEIVTDKLSNKKALLEKRVNRSDNFINLALLGVQKCVRDIPLNKQTSIYLASKKGNMNTTIKVLNDIFINHTLPMPFNFLNSVNASQLFFLAKNFEIEGKTLFVDKFESALSQAFVDIKQGKTVLVGTVEEVIDDLEFHKKRFGVEKIEESSRWLILSTELKRLEPIAQIYDFKFTQTTQVKNSISVLFSFLENRDNIFEFCGENLIFKIKKLNPLKNSQ
jgi:hypothetical protein